MHVSASLDDDGVEVSVDDDGLGMRPRLDSPGVGLGLPLIADLADRVEITSRGPGTRIAARFTLMGPAGPHGRAAGAPRRRARRTAYRPASLRLGPGVTGCARAAGAWTNQSRAAPLERSKSAM